ncbi:MAG: hypothetical protein M3680_12075 [Myxococcota bacterium]|nr:hypothetical protein [Myxococcota bacterium]
MKLQSKNEQNELRLDGDGKVWIDAQQVALLTSDGSAKKLDGSVLATLGADGTLQIPGEADGLMIREDGAILKGGQVQLEIAADGTVTGPMAKEIAGTLTVAGAAEGRRAIMLAWLVAMTGERETTMQ